MKLLILLFTTLFTFNLFAQVQDASNTSGVENREKKRFMDNISLSFETEANTVRNKEQNDEITGRYQRYGLELSGKLPYSLTASVVIQYDKREFNEDSEADNRDHLAFTFVKLRHNTLSFKENNLLDLRLQARYYKVEDPFFRERFGADGNYQMRAYFGRPLFGKFHINKYVSYLRYKKYNLNSDASDRSRDHELRARISPTYRPTRDWDFGVTATYNHIFTTSEEEEELELGVSVRKQIGKYAILFFTSNELYNEI